VFHEQMSIVVVGYGFADLAYYQTPPVVEKERAVACPVCGYDYVVSPSKDDYLKHRVKHIKAVHKKLREKGGKPATCPDPQLKVCRLCVIDEDQTVNPIGELQREQGKKATAMVESGRIKATSERVGEAVAPEVNDALIGRTIQYVCTIFQKGSKKSERYTYTGRIISVKVYDFILSPPDKLSQAKRKKDKGGRARGKVQKRDKASGAVVGVACPSVFVTWREPTPDERVFLVHANYGSKKQDGWIIVEDDAIAPDAKQATTSERIAQRAMESGALHFKAE
jgi:hypothetical protein